MLRWKLALALDKFSNSVFSENEDFITPFRLVFRITFYFLTRENFQYRNLQSSPYYRDFINVFFCLS